VAPARVLVAVRGAHRAQRVARPEQLHHVLRGSDRRPQAWPREVHAGHFGLAHLGEGGEAGRARTRTHGDQQKKTE
jgi:hypothetical protein